MRFAFLVVTVLVACGRGEKALAPLPASDVYSDIASDGEHVYFVGGSSIDRVPVAGGALETVVASIEHPAFGVRAGTLAWVSLNQGLTIRNASGDHVVTLPDGTAAADTAPLVDEHGAVYFEALARESQTPATTLGQIWSWDPATATAQPMSGISREGGGVALFYVDRGQLFWSANGLMATDLSTGNAHALDAAGPISFIGLDATNLYAEEGICPGSCPFTVWAVPRDGTARFIAYQTKAAYFTNGLTADDSGLYWVDWTSKALYHTTLDASSPDALARFGNLLPGQFALDATNVYWLDANGTGASQQVMAVPK